MPKHNSRGTHSSSDVGTKETNKLKKKKKERERERESKFCQVKSILSDLQDNLGFFEAIHLLNCSEI